MNNETKIIGGNGYNVNAVTAFIGNETPITQFNFNVTKETYFFHNDPEVFSIKENLVAVWYKKGTRDRTPAVAEDDDLSFLFKSEEEDDGFAIPPYRELSIQEEDNLDEFKADLAYERAEAKKEDRFLSNCGLTNYAIDDLPF